MIRRNSAPRLAWALLPFAIFGYLAFKSTEIWNPNRFPNFSEPITTRGLGLFYITDPSASTKMHLIELGFCLSSLLRCLRSCSIPNAGVHRRTGEQVSGTTHSCDPVPREGESGFWEAPSATSHLLRHGSSSVQVRSCGVPSSAAPVAALRSKDRLRLVYAFRLPDGSRTVRIL